MASSDQRLPCSGACDTRRVGREREDGEEKPLSKEGRGKHQEWKEGPVNHEGRGKGGNEGVMAGNVVVMWVY